MRSRVLIAMGIALASTPRAGEGQDSRTTFPVVQGRNLEGRDLELPADFSGERNVVLVAFRQRQQREVNSWLPSLTVMRREAGDLGVYEIPALSRGWIPLRGWIDGGMASGIADRATREATITLYINKGPFKQALGIGDESRIQVLLLDDAGRVLHREYGAATADAVRRLRVAMGLPPAPRASP